MLEPYLGKGQIVTEGMCVRIPLCWAGCVSLWVVSLGLLVWDTLVDVDMAGRWALYLSAAAAAWTVINARRSERRRIVAGVRRAWQEEQLETLVR